MRRVGLVFMLSIIVRIVPIVREGVDYLFVLRGFDIVETP